MVKIYDVPIFRVNTSYTIGFVFVVSQLFKEASFKVTSGQIQIANCGP